MKAKVAICALTATAISSLSVATASATTLTDGDFASITKSMVSTTGSFALGAGQCTACGNPSGLGLSVLVGAISTTSGASVSEAITDNALTYNPSVSGAITSLNAQYDREILSTTSGEIFPVTFRLVAAQGSGIFATSIDLGGTQNAGGYSTLSRNGLTAADFSLISGTGLLNFASGSQITFGVEAILSPASLVTETANFDNFEIAINNTPLPAALPLFATGLGGLGLFGWLSKRKSRVVAAA